MAWASDLGYRIALDWPPQTQRETVKESAFAWPPQHPPGPARNLQKVVRLLDDSERGKDGFTPVGSWIDVRDLTAGDQRASMKMDVVRIPGKLPIFFGRHPFAFVKPLVCINLTLYSAD